jgi:hypothetical protein
LDHVSAGVLVYRQGMTRLGYLVRVGCAAAVLAATLVLSAAQAAPLASLEPNDPFSYTALSVTYQRAFAGTNNMQYIRMAEDAMEKSRMLQGRR